MKHILYFARKIYAYAGITLFITLFGMVIISFLDGMAIFLIIPMINMSGIVSISLSSTPLMQWLALPKEIPQTLGLPIILGGYLILVAGQSFLQRSLTIRNVKINIGFTNLIRLETYRALLQANWDFYLKKRKSDLINSFTNELGRIVSGTNTFLQLLTSIVFTLIQLGIAFWLSAKMTILVLLCGILLFYFSRRFLRRAQILGNQTSEIGKSYLAGITDHFNGIKDIKSNTLEQSRYQWLRSWCKKIEKEQLNYIKLKTESQLYFKLASAVLIACFIFISVRMLDVQPGYVLLIVLIFSRLWPRFSGIQASMEQLASSIPAFKAMIELQEESRKAREQEGKELYQDVTPLVIEHGLECRHVFFRYSPSDPQLALQDINMHIPSKQMTAIVGRSGAGKSTLIDIVMGLLLPEEGQVLIDGVPLSDHNLLALRRSISYVPQDPFLFNGSIRDNLLMIEPYASETQLWEALKFSASADFVSRLPHGLDTVIGDRGVRLSGGERQRLVLARAILRKPSILILDEATSALDTENEAKIQEALERLKGKMTIVVIAHRLSTIRNADQVIVLDRGTIQQKGRFMQLAGESGGLFSKLLENQFADAKVVV